VVEDVEETGGKTDDGKSGHPFGEPEHAHPDAEQNDPDVFDAVIGEETLQVVLRQGKQDPEHTTRRAHRNQQPAPPGRRRAEKGEHADETVDPDLDHRP
jgi:hypothetical protein